MSERGPSAFREPPFIDFLGDLETIGVRPVERGGWECAVIRARTNSRWWLLPLEDRRNAAAGLEMLQAVTWSAALAKGAARVAALAGQYWALRGSRLRLSGAPALEGAFAHEAKSFAYFTGTEGPHRKTAIQIMGASGCILGYAKLSRGPLVQRFIVAETEALSEVGTLRLRTADVPRVVVAAQKQSYTLLVTDSTKSSRYSTPLRFGAPHRAFLNELTARTSRAGATETLNRLARDIDALRGALGTDWVARFEAGLDMLRSKQEVLPVGFAHGDFTPWNSFLQSGRLYVFDWEYADRAYPVGYDQLHFMLATIGDGSPRAVSDLIIEELSEAQYGGDRDLARHAALFSLLQHAAFYLRRSMEAGEALIGFELERQRAALIDVLRQRDFKK